MTEAFEGALLDELFTSPVANAKGMEALFEVALAAHQLYHLLDVPDRTIC